MFSVLVVIGIICTVCTSRVLTSLFIYNGYKSSFCVHYTYKFVIQDAWCTHMSLISQNAVSSALIQDVQKFANSFTLYTGCSEV